MDEISDRPRRTDPPREARDLGHLMGTQILLLDDGDPACSTTELFSSLDLPVGPCGTLEAAASRLREDPESIFVVVLRGDGGATLRALDSSLEAWMLERTILLGSENRAALRAFALGVGGFVRVPVSPARLWAALARVALGRAGRF